MLYQLSKSNAEYLKTQPETGMGYQLVEVRQEKYTPSELIVFNGIYALPYNSISYPHILKAILENKMEQAFGKSPHINVHINRVLSLDQTSVLKEYATGKIASGKDGASEQANGDELFVRLSAFNDDIRVDKKNKCLLPGSYTTMVADALRCKTNRDNPVERYALPVELPIEWAFYIQPLSVDILQRGWVQPNFGKRGGGRESFFEKGTSGATFITETKW